MKDYNTYVQNFNPYSSDRPKGETKDLFWMKHYDGRTGNYVSGKYYDERTGKYKRKTMCRKTTLDYKPTSRRGTHRKE